MNDDNSIQEFIQHLEYCYESNPDELAAHALKAFQVGRKLTVPDSPEWLLRLSCLGVLADRIADVRSFLMGRELLGRTIKARNWEEQVWRCVLEVWLRLIRKDGYRDLDIVKKRVAELRKYQKKLEPQFLHAADAQPAWELVASYHLVRAAEILGTYFSQGSITTHFDHAITATRHGQSMEKEALVRILSKAAKRLIEEHISLTE